MDEETLKSAMGSIADETAHKHRARQESARRKNIKLKYRNWWYGLAISFIPLFAIPVANIVLDNASLCDFLFKLFSSCEIIFIGVSIAITALNDFQGSNIKKEKNWMAQLSMVLIVFGTLIYGVIALCQDRFETINVGFVLGFNVIFLITIIALASAQYISKLQEIK